MNKILLLGSDINVYYMARCYYELYHTKADVLGKEEMRFTKGSSIINISYNEKLRQKDAFLKILIDYYKEHYTNEKVLLVPCHDVYVRLVVENADELKKYYTFNTPNEKIMDSFLVKEKFYETYKNSTLDFPQTYFYDVTKTLNIPENFKYPLILKPGDGLLYYRHHFENQAKVYRLNTKEELEEVVNQIKKSGYDGNLIIQEYIPGDDTNLFDSVFYVNTKGKACLASFAQIGLQEHGPTALGNCTVLINNYNQYGKTKETVEKLKNFLEGIGYTGFAEFDLKFDPRDQKFKVLEINPRQARSSYYLCACGYNLVKYLMEDLFENKEHKFEFIKKEILLSMVPKCVIKSEIKNEEYKKKALELYSKRTDPLTYKEDKGLEHRIYLQLRKIQYIKKYRKYKWWNMCGFTGFINKKTKKEKEKIIKDMNDTIIHRGPDGEGYYVDDNIAMGFRRLSIIDLKGGDQPLYNENKDLVINFNGEIYNFQELKEELIKCGHKFKTKSDTEVIIHGYEEYGYDIVNKLRGMFAFVIWDIKNEKLFGARDYFGIKPFYYYLNEDKFIYGSEIKSFIKCPEFEKEMNKEALKNYLVFQYSPLEETFFKNVYKLMPGHYFVYENGKMEKHKYFQIEYKNDNNNLENIIDGINDIMKDSIEHHKISDVEVGSFLSSGVDSSYIVSNANVSKTYTVGFEGEGGFNEINDAKDLSNLLGIENTNELITPEMFFDAVPKVQYYSDEPHANLSAVPLYYLARLASRDVKVVLSGEGADELFGGYFLYDVPKEYTKYNKVPFGIRHLVKNLVCHLPNFKGKHFLIEAGSKIEDKYIGQAFIMNNDEANDILTDEYKSNLRYQDITKQKYEDVKDKDEVLKKMYLDMNFWLPSDILLKADKMTMASSLELRVPFLDKEVFEYSTHIGVPYIVNNHTTKYAFRKAAEKTVPREWSTRPKLGFLVPFKNWLKEDKYYNIVKNVFNKDTASEFFDIKKINKLLDDHHNGKWNNARKIYTIYTFLVWYNIYFGEIKWKI